MRQNRPRFHAAAIMAEMSGKQAARAIEARARRTPPETLLQIVKLQKLQSVIMTEQMLEFYLNL